MLEVRLARPEEYAAVGALTVAAYTKFTLGPDDPYLDKLADAAIRATQADLLVAIDGDELLGTATSCPPGSPWLELAGPAEGEFRMLAVADAARGRGVGTALVQACEQRAVGATAMVLSSLPEMSSAHRLYGRLGYRRAPDRDWSPVPGTSLVAFVKDLSGDLRRASSPMRD